MATITDLPNELLHHIIFLLVQSSTGPTDLARIISVCRSFLVFTGDVHILKVVSFDSKMECKELYNHQHINGLLVRCSEAGNMVACFLLGKVILQSSFQLLINEWQKVNLDASPFDLATLSQIRVTRVPAENSKHGFFMTYFLPEQASTSESSRTRLVHYQLVKLFLRYGSHHEIIEMRVFLNSYIKCFTRGTNIDRALFDSVNVLFLYASRFRSMETLDKMSQRLNDMYMVYCEAEHHSKGHEDPSSAPSRRETDEFGIFLRIFVSRCNEVGVDWREALSDEVRPLKHHFDAAYSDFTRSRAQTLRCLELKFE